MHRQRRARSRASGIGRAVSVLVVSLIVSALVAETATAQARSARIAGPLATEQTVRVLTTGGPATQARWQQCLVRVVRNRCNRPSRLRPGRTLRIPRGVAGRSIRSVVRIRGRQVATRWSAPVRRPQVRPVAPGGPGVPAPGEPLVIPAGWQATGSAATLPFEPGIGAVERERRLREISGFYARIDALVRGGRSLFHFESLGNADLLTEIRVELCSDLTFTRRLRQSGLGPVSEDTEGTWRIRVDLTSDNPVPVLTLSATDGSVRREQLEPDRNDAGRVLLGDRSFVSGPSQVCS
jgi:hypothetical protein